MVIKMMKKNFLCIKKLQENSLNLNQYRRPANASNTGDDYLSYRIEIYTEFNLATWLKLVKVTELLMNFDFL